MIRNYARRLYRFAIRFFYSRRQFRLFVHSAFGDIDLRMLALASMTDYFSAFVRPVPVRAPFGKSMLILAPHQDDETIGCGGALVLQLRSGGKANVVLLHDGAEGCEDLGLERRAMCEMRNEESRQAAAVVQMNPPVFLNYPDLSTSYVEAVESVRDLIMQNSADAIFVPFILDGHPDHRTANYILAKALRDIPWNVRVFGYEVWGLAVPNVIVVIDEVVETKMAMLSCFTFANKAIDYVHSTRGLNMYRSRLLGAGECRYAECFFEVPRTEYIDVVNRVRAAEITTQ